MKRRNILFNLLIIILFAQLIQAGGVGISPAFYREFFESNLTKTYRFHSFNVDPEKGVNIYVKGDLSQYVNLSKKYMLGGGEFTATINLPDKIEKPGVHTILIGVIETETELTSNIGGIAAIQGRIDIIVPYPGKYAESTFTISNINEKEEANYEITSQNLGSSVLKVNTKIEVYKINTTEKIITEIIKESTLKPKETLTIKGNLQTQNLPPGEYYAIATIDWGKTEIINKSFKIGEFLVEIIDYDYQFERGKINPFKIQIQNKWNTPIDRVFASVSITDAGILIGSFKTVSVETSPWEIKNITGYLDTSNLETKRYTARIALSYGDTTTSKLVAIYINDPSIKRYRNYIIIGVVVILIIIIVFLYLILKIIKLKNENKK